MVSGAGFERVCKWRWNWIDKISWFCGDATATLFEMLDKYDCFYIVGGGIHEDESSAKVVVRELYEETGYRFEIERLIFIQERFFKVGNIRHHEVVFFYLMKEADIKLQNGIFWKLRKSGSLLEPKEERYIHLPVTEKGWKQNDIW